MEINLKKIGNGWIVTIRGIEVELVHDGLVPIEHFEPTFPEVLAYLHKLDLK